MNHILNVTITLHSLLVGHTKFPYLQMSRQYGFIKRQFAAMTSILLPALQLRLGQPTKVPLYLSTLMLPPTEREAVVTGSCNTTLGCDRLAPVRPKAWRQS